MEAYVEPEASPPKPKSAHCKPMQLDADDVSYMDMAKAGCEGQEEASQVSRRDNIRGF